MQQVLKKTKVYYCHIFLKSKEWPLDWHKKRFMCLEFSRLLITRMLITYTNGGQSAHRQVGQSAHSLFCIKNSNNKMYSFFKKLSLPMVSEVNWGLLSICEPNTLKTFPFVWDISMITQR